MNITTNKVERLQNKIEITERKLSEIESEVESLLSDIEIEVSFDSSYASLENDVNVFIQESEIIGYWNAMQYLIENDCSLEESMELASGFSASEIHSELLATLLYQQRMYESFAEITSDIDQKLEEYAELESEVNDLEDQLYELD